MSKHRELVERMIGAREIPIFGNINKESFELVSDALIYLNAKDSTAPIKLYIKSTGGNVEQGLYIHDAVQASKAPVIGIVIGQAHSMAAVALQGCSERIATMNSTICLHNISMRVEVSLKTEKSMHHTGVLDIEHVKRQMRRGVNDMRAICGIFAKKSGMSIEKVITIIRQGKIMNAKEAFALGLLDKVVHTVDEKWDIPA